MQLLKGKRQVGPALCEGREATWSSVTDEAQNPSVSECVCWWSSPCTPQQKLDFRAEAPKPGRPETPKTGSSSLQMAWPPGRISQYKRARQSLRHQMSIKAVKTEGVQEQLCCLKVSGRQPGLRDLVVSALIEGLRGCPHLLGGLERRQGSGTSRNRLWADRWWFLRAHVST